VTRPPDQEPADRWDEWHEAVTSRQFEIEAAITATLPELAEAARRQHAPRIRVKCPGGHYLFTVTLFGDFKSDPELYMVNKGSGYENGLRVAAPARPMDGPTPHTCTAPDCGNLRPCPTHDDTPEGEQFEGLTTRNEFHCPENSCGRKPQYLKSTLTRLYVDAVLRGKKVIRLTS
jgi:hypothetical protein